MAANQHRPVLALAMGDPCGISPELTAKIMMDAEVRAAADVIVIGDRRVLAEGETVAQGASDHLYWRPGAPLALDHLRIATCPWAATAIPGFSGCSGSTRRFSGF